MNNEPVAALAEALREIKALPAIYRSGNKAAILDAFDDIATSITAVLREVAAVEVEAASRERERLTAAVGDLRLPSEKAAAEFFGAADFRRRVLALLASPAQPGERE